MRFSAIEFWLLVSYWVAIALWILPQFMSRGEHPLGRGFADSCVGVALLIAVAIPLVAVVRRIGRKGRKHGA